MWQGSNFSGYKFEQKSHTVLLFRPSEIYCQPDPTERNCSLRHVTTKNMRWSFRKAKCLRLLSPVGWPLQSKRHIPPSHRKIYPFSRLDRMNCEPCRPRGLLSITPHFLTCSKLLSGGIRPPFLPLIFVLLNTNKIISISWAPLWWLKWLCLRRLRQTFTLSTK